MLALEEIRSIFPDDEVQTGDIMSAMWPPNGQCCDAKVAGNI